VITIIVSFTLILDHVELLRFIVIIIKYVSSIDLITNSKGLKNIDICPNY